MNSLTHSREWLQSEWSRVQSQWRVTGGLWNDPVRQRFEREFWQQYEPAIRAALKEMDRLAEVIAQAQREVK